MALKRYLNIFCVQTFFLYMLVLKDGCSLNFYILEYQNVNFYEKTIYFFLVLDQQTL